MGGSPQAAFAFLVTFSIDLFNLLVFTRFLLQLVQADFYNPVSQFVVRATNPLLVPLRRVIPGFGGIDLAALVLALLLVATRLIAGWLILFGAIPADGSYLVLAFIHETAYLLLNYMMFLVFTSIIASWVLRDPYHPIYKLLHRLAGPIMDPARRLLPPINGIDFSPILVLVVISFLRYLFGLRHSVLVF